MTKNIREIFKYFLIKKKTIIIVIMINYKFERIEVNNILNENENYTRVT